MTLRCIFLQPSGTGTPDRVTCITNVYYSDGTCAAYRYRGSCRNSLSLMGSNSHNGHRPRSTPEAVQLAAVAPVVSRRQSPSAGVCQRRDPSGRQSSLGPGNRGLIRRRSALVAGPDASRPSPPVPCESTRLDFYDWHHISTLLDSITVFSIACSAYTLQFSTSWEASQPHHQTSPTGALSIHLDTHHSDYCQSNRDWPILDACTLHWRWRVYTIASYKQTHSPTWLAWSAAWQVGSRLQCNSSDELGELSQWLLSRWQRQLSQLHVFRLHAYYRSITG